jgi:hypothetical protein
MNDNKTNPQNGPDLRRRWPGLIGCLTGLAAILLLLLVAFVYLNNMRSISSPETVLVGSEATAAVPTLTAVSDAGPQNTPYPMPEAVGTSLSVQLDGVFFGNQIQLVGYEIEERHGWLTVRLHWAPLAEWPDYLHVSIEAVDVAGHAVHVGWHLLLGKDRSADSREDLLGLGPQYEFPVMVAQERVGNGRCRIILSLRDGSVSGSMAVTAADATRVIDNGTALLLADWECYPEREPLTLDLTQAVERGLGQTVNAVSADGSLRLLTFERLLIGGEIGIALTWEVLRPPPSDFRESFALFKAWGDGGMGLVTIPVVDSQASRAVPPPAAWQTGDTITRYFLLRLPPGQPRLPLVRDRRFQLWMPAGLPCTEGWPLPPVLDEAGQPLQVCAFFIDGIEVKNGQLVASATDWQWGIGRVLTVPADHAAIMHLYADLTGTDLLTIPTDGLTNLIAYGERIIAERVLVVFTDETSGETVAEGWMASDDYNGLLRFGLATDSANRLANHFWFHAATQAERPSPDAPVTLEVEIRYSLTTDDDIRLKLFYAAPDWQTQPDSDQPPPGEMSAWLTLDPHQSLISHIFTADPQQMIQLAGTEQPVLVAQMARFAGDQAVELLTNQTFADHPFDLTQTEEVAYPYSSWNRNMKLSVEQPVAGSHLQINEPLVFQLNLDPGVSMWHQMIYADLILATPIDGQLHWVASDSFTRHETYRAKDLTVTPAQLARLPQESGQLILMAQLRVAGESEPYFIYRPPEYRWTYTYGP